MRSWTTSSRLLRSCVLEGHLARSMYGKDRDFMYSPWKHDIDASFSSKVADLLVLGLE